MPTDEEIKAGCAAYTKHTLKLYDLVVLGLSNRFIWCCPTARLLAQYHQSMTQNHLDVGVGTGYFLDHCQLDEKRNRLALLDINEACLEVARKRLARFLPETIVADIYQPIKYQGEKFDSLGLNYVLHCIPGTMRQKSTVLCNLKTLLNANGLVFGSTLLQHGVRHNPVSRYLMAFYNKKRIFSTACDSLSDLTTILHTHFKDVRIEIVGCAALFSGRTFA